MIITVTLNPALDKTLVLNRVSMGEVNRVDSTRNDMGGKGINVSKVLKELGMISTATGFLGGILEEVFRKELKCIGITDEFQSVSGNTRTNIKVVDEERKEYTEFNEPGPEILPEELSDFYDKYHALVKEGDLVVLSGGVSQGVPKEIYGTLTKMAKEKGARVLVDAEGEALVQAIHEIPYMVKPNERELAGIVGKEALNVDEMIHEGEKLVKKGIQLVLISRGAEGSILLTDHHTFIAEGLKVPVRSTVGAGDAMVAALAFGLEMKMSPKEMLTLAQASGAAAVMKEGTQAATKEEIYAHVKDAERKIKEWKR